MVLVVVKPLAQLTDVTTVSQHPVHIYVDHHAQVVGESLVGIATCPIPQRQNPSGRRGGRAALSQADATQESNVRLGGVLIPR